MMTTTLVFTRLTGLGETVTVKGQTDNFSDGDQNYTIILTGDSSTTDLASERGSCGCFGAKS